MEDFGTQPEAQMTPPSSGAPELVGQWSWAGFLFSGLYLVGHNYMGLGLGLIVAMIVLGWIPVVGQLIVLGIMLFVGIKGHEYAWSSGVYTTGDEFMAVQRIVNTMGKVGFFVAIVWIIVAWLVSLIFGAMFAGIMGGAGGLEGAFPAG